MKSKIKWLTEPKAGNYPAAASYLNLLYDDNIVGKLISSLQKESIKYFKSKDILRASLLTLLDKENYHVRKDLDKIKNDEEISPILLIRTPNKVIIADGYHRLCAVYYSSEDEPIPCRITTL